MERRKIYAKSVMRTLTTLHPGVDAASIFEQNVKLHCYSIAPSLYL